MFIANICSVILLILVALTFLTQQRSKQQTAASKIATWFNERDDGVGQCIVSNRNDFPVYNIFTFIIPNNFKSKNVKRIFAHVIKNQDDLYLNQQLLEKNECNDPEQVGVGIEQMNREANFKTLVYFENLPPGDKDFLFDNNYSSGHGHGVPGIFFTDNQNIEWLRFSDGSLHRKKYIKTATKLAVLFSHV
ncbi:hypothetical protein ACFQ22_02120 [Lentilactobacillus raoultii]|uniref:Uncharacterized protein n=1 Tax=Lentilactobacillus raoultii TaxID=1987503 RepID=A0ABW3PI96_9LACO|nr:hypothetical protein [Lentilactobacillus raoultii]